MIPRRLLPNHRKRKAGSHRGSEHVTPPHQPNHAHRKSNADQRLSQLPTHNHNGHKITRHIHPDGESGRQGVHLWLFLKLCFISNCTASKWVNLLWPAVPAAIVMHFVLGTSKQRSAHLAIFILNWIGMLPSANLLSFAGDGLARKLPKVWGVIVETTLGSVVEVVLFMTLLVKHDKSRGDDYIPFIRDAILGSILANLLLCLGLCFFFGGMRRKEQEFHESVSEVGSALLLVAGMALVVPSTFYATTVGKEGGENAAVDSLRISRLTSVVLLIAFIVFIWFQTHTHHGIFDEVLVQDEEKDDDRHRDLARDKLTFTECMIAVVFALVCVSLISVFLVLEIKPLVYDYQVQEVFVGVILIPLAEKAAAHISAIDEAWDNQMNFALSHILGSTVQTALLNGPLVVLVGWAMRKPMDLDFQIFMSAMLILAILVVGNFLRDGKSNYLEGALCVVVYIIIAITTWYLPAQH